eukprot:CAMPEP_0204266494 /NCGR_PEP_ID=MMETSP0468-20130131/10366_1 /ASSEMBLY_ACC=CAM_ASM_000383 /TAXON_ID=2969 /ORGANISM="Oxyrrhis marina" /LENGTH=65 /DNA_ID=CAMNT_0051241567 /DNA_START=134 /DNA_END=329 /DNA_ORIENTATION=+
MSSWQVREAQRSLEPRPADPAAPAAAPNGDCLLPVQADADGGKKAPTQDLGNNVQGRDRDRLPTS